MDYVTKLNRAKKESLGVSCATLGNAFCVAMRTCLLDTNVCIVVGKDRPTFESLANKQGKTHRFVLPPISIIELFRGIARGGETRFQRNKQTIERVRQLRSKILDLPEPFMWKVLWGSTFGTGTVQPSHYEQLLEMFMVSPDYAGFLARARTEAGRVWRDIDKAESIHVKEVANELRALRDLSSRHGALDLAWALSRKYPLGGLIIAPESVRDRFSAALEFLYTALHMVKIGAKPEQNDPGLYGDFQLFWYLAEPQNHIVSAEDFTSKIKHSPQRTRILPLSTLVSA